VRKLVVFVVLSILIVAGAPPAKADDTECTGAPVPMTGTFDNIVVPPGESCFLLDSTVMGNVLALAGSQLEMHNNDVLGNVQADGAQRVEIENGNTVRGNIEFKELMASNDQIGIFDTTVQGNIQIEGGSILVLFVRANVVSKGNIKVEENTFNEFAVIDVNSVGQNLQVFKNRATDFMEVFGNMNDGGGNLQCTENTAPLFFSFNPGWPADKKEGQCMT
jgi:hypothetical protein